MRDEAEMNELRSIFSESRWISEGGFDFVHIETLMISIDSVVHAVEALLCPQERDGYRTRLFLSKAFPSNGRNWSEHHILGRIWHTYSWQHVSADQRLAQILAGHLDAFR